MNELRDSGVDPLIIDAGDLFFSKNIIEPGISKEIAIINANIIYIYER